MEPRARILIIDDEPALLFGLAATVRKRGFAVTTASDGQDGLTKAKQAVPDLIVCDVMMPPPNGFELRRLLSLDPKLASVPFIFLTARTAVEDRVDGIRGGADDYITKPFVPEELLARIEALLRRVTLEQQHGREQMRAAAEEDMQRLQKEILRNFHHELRTPLTNIIMPLEMVVQKKFTDPEEQSRFINAALSSVDRLESLVTDFILLTEIDQDGLNRIRQPVDVQLHVLLPIEKRLERYKSKSLKLLPEVRVSGAMSAPRREFTTAVVHLLDNAFKFSPPGGTVQLRIDAAGQGGACIDVQDEGPGVPPELREKVFERFFQVSQGDSRQHDGLGVGLTIARAVFRNAAGNVTITDSPTGCRVQAVLPDPRPGDITYG
jgi:two-component system, sensor histidine kinase and response regulator